MSRMNENNSLYIRNFIISDQKNETDFLIYKNKFVKILIAVTE